MGDGPARTQKMFESTSWRKDTVLIEIKKYFCKLEKNQNRVCVRVERK